MKLGRHDVEHSHADTFLTSLINKSANWPPTNWHKTARTYLKSSTTQAAVKKKFGTTQVGQSKWKHFLFRNLSFTLRSETHPPLPCQDCPKVSSNPLSLQKHRYHHTGQQLKCDNCVRTFPFDSQLRDHRKSHFKRKPHRCSFPNCDVEATHLYDIKKHERVHLKKQHKCPSCDYTMLDARYLNQHKKVHSEVNTYHCDKCGKTFRFYMQKKKTPLLNIQKSV